jgi:hypothetical protein
VMHELKADTNWLESFAATGSYYVSVSSFILTFAALLASFLIFRSTLKQYNDQKKTEIDQTKISNNRERIQDAFEIFKIILGIRDTVDGHGAGEKAVKTAHVSAALVALRQYPEFHDALLVQKRFFDSVDTKTAHNIWVKAQIDATFEYWNKYSYEDIAKHHLVSFDQVAAAVDAAEVPRGSTSST